MLFLSILGAFSIQYSYSIRKIGSVSLASRIPSSAQIRFLPIAGAEPALLKPSGDRLFAGKRPVTICQYVFIFTGAKFEPTDGGKDFFSISDLDEARTVATIFLFSRGTHAAL